MNRYGTPDEPKFNIPNPIEFIDAVSLDVELQLIREEFREEMAPIDAAWAAYEPRRTYGQLLPMQRYEPVPVVRLTGLQLQFVRHLVWTGEISSMEADGLITRPGFQSGLDVLHDMYGPNCLAGDALDSYIFMREVRRSAEGGGPDATNEM
jgi:hypothetical protein